MKHSDHIKVKVGLHTFALKHLEVYTRISEETTAFYADLYIGEWFIGTCENSGKGEGNYPRLHSHLDMEVIGLMYDKIVEDVGKHHYHRDATRECPYECDRDYDMDFLISEMVLRAWYFGETTYKFNDEL